MYIAQCVPDRGFNSPTVLSCNILQLCIARVTDTSEYTAREYLWSVRYCLAELGVVTIFGAHATRQVMRVFALLRRWLSRKSWLKKFPDVVALAPKIFATPSSASCITFNSRSCLCCRRCTRGTRSSPHPRTRSESGRGRTRLFHRPFKSLHDRFCVSFPLLHS